MSACLVPLEAASSTPPPSRRGGGYFFFYHSQRSPLRSVLLRWFMAFNTGSINGYQEYVAVLCRQRRWKCLQKKKAPPLPLAANQIFHLHCCHRYFPQLTWSCCELTASFPLSLWSWLSAPVVDVQLNCLTVVADRCLWLLRRRSTHPCLLPTDAAACFLLWNHACILGYRIFAELLRLPRAASERPFSRTPLCLNPF